MNEAKALVLRCPSCKKNYKCRDGPSTKVWNEPRLLNCGHVICSQCLRNKAKSPLKSIICECCSAETDLNDLDCFNKVPSAIYLVGLTHEQRYFGQYNRSEATSTSHSRPAAQDVTMKKEFCLIDTCYVCGQKTELIRCQECNQDMCKKCFQQLHTGHGDNMSAHVPIYLSKNLSYRLNDCPKHHRAKDFYCLTEEKLICPTCFLSEHKGHDYEDIRTRNKSLEQNINDAYKDLHYMKSNLEKTFKHVETLEANKEGAKQAVIQIKTAFNYLYGRLQLWENELILQAEKDCVVEALKKEIHKNLDSILTLMEDYNVLRKYPHTFDFMELHKQMKQALDLPCKLQEVTTENEPSKSPSNQSFDVDKIMDTLKSFVKVEEIPNTREWKLISVSKEDLAADDKNVVSSGPPKEKPAVANGVVRLSFGYHPGEFYLQRKSDINKLQSLHMKVNAYCPEKAEKFTVCPKLGDHLFAFYWEDDQNGMWYRGRVVNPAPTILNTQKVVVQKPLDSGLSETVSIFFIDYGNTASIPLSNVRVLPQEFLEIGPLAIKCSLYDTLPMSDAGWDMEAVNAFQDLTANRYMEWRSYECRANIHYVDLLIPNKDDPQSSVRETIMLLGLACFESDKSPSFESTGKCFGESYFQPFTPEVGEAIRVVVTNMEGPHLFHVQEVRQYEGLFSSMQAEIQQFYEKPEANNLMIYTPSTGRPCIAKYEVDNSWNRAIVTSDVNERKGVEVNFVDYGNNTTVHCKDLRRIDKNFLKYSPFALKCQLANVNRSKRSLHFFARRISSTSVYKMIIIEKPLKSEPLLVALFDGVCINSTLEDQTYLPQEDKTYIPQEDKSSLPQTPALRSTGGTPELNGYECNRELNAQDALMAAFLRFQLNESSSESASKSLEMETSLDSCKDVTSFNETHVMLKEDCAIPEEECAMKTEFIKAGGSVSFIESPFLIYFQPFKENQNRLLNLMKDVQKCCTLPNTKTSWGGGDSCAVYHPKRKQFYRGKVLEVFKETAFARVLCIDYGFSVNCDLESVRELSEELERDPPYAIRCYLSTIIPAGDKFKWSSLACERLFEVIEKFKTLTIEKLGEEIDGAYPVDLFYEEFEPGGALTASKIHVKSISRFLLDNGMALPAKRSPVRTKNCESSIDEKINIIAASEPDMPPGNILLEMSKEDAQDSFSDEMGNMEKSDSHLLEPDVMIECVQSDCPKEESDCPKEESDCPKEESDGRNGSLIEVSTDNRRKWRRPRKPLNNKMTAVITYVDSDGSIYLQDTEHVQELHIMQEGMKLKYQRSESQHEDTYWFKGDICLVRDSKVGNWYRATVTEVGEETNSYTVQYLDYGNYDTVKFQNMRKNVAYLDRHQQAYKCKLARIRPKTVDGKWPSDLSEFLKTIVVNGKPWSVTFESFALRKDEPWQISLESEDHINPVKEILALEGLADEIVVESSEDEVLPSDADYSPYNFCPVPDVGDKIPVALTHINEHPLRLYMQRRLIETPYSDSDIEVNNQLRKLSAINSYITQNHSTLPLVEKPEIGYAVACRYSLDNTWYRGVIERIENDKVMVLFVDYGNKEVTSCEYIRDLPTEYVELPMQAIECCLHQIVLPNDEGYAAAVNTLRDCLDEIRSEVLYAEIKDNGDPVKIDLLVFDEKNGVSLAYCSLVESGIIRLVREKTLAEIL